MRRHVRSLGAAVALWGLAAPCTSVAPVAAASHGAICHIRTVFSGPNGVMLAKPTGPSPMSSGREPGTVTCEGLINGRRPSGPGTFGYAGYFGVGPLGGDTCAFGGGYGTFSITVPTAGGRLSLTEPFMFYGGPAGVITSPHVSGLYEVVATTGDCVTTPLTEGTLHAQVVIAGWPVGP
jgi:hypothetical protein